MKTAIILASVFVASVASAADSPKKPSVCVSFEILEGKSKSAAICYDGEKPKLYTAWSVVEVSHPAGGKVRYLLGF